MISLTDALRKEVGPLGNKAIVVEPGAFRTDFAGRSLTQSARAIADYNATADRRILAEKQNDGLQASGVGKLTLRFSPAIRIGVHRVLATPMRLARSLIDKAQLSSDLRSLFPQNASC